MKIKLVLIITLGLLAVRLEAAPVFVNATHDNTEAATPGWTDDWYADRTPPQWRDRDTTEGLDVFTSDEDAYEGSLDLGLGINDYIMIKTTITGLVPFQYYSIYLNYATADNGNWSIMGGLSPETIEGFSATNVTIGTNDHIGIDDASGRVTDTGRRAGGNSHLPIYRALLGVTYADARGEIEVFIDDSDNENLSGASDQHRCWYDGLEYEISVPSSGSAHSPVPTGTINKDTNYSGSLSWSAPDVAGDPNLLEVISYDVYLYYKPTESVTEDDPNALEYTLRSSGQTGTSYTMSLDYGYTYFWRVDSNVIFNNNDSLVKTVEGADWSFDVLDDNAFPILGINGDLTTSLDFLPVAALTATVDDNGEDDIADVTWEISSFRGAVESGAREMTDRSGNATYEDYASQVGNADLIIDWISADCRWQGNPLVLTIKELPPGSYSWKSYHHDTSNQTGIFDITVIDSSGAALTPGINISDSNSLPVTTFETSITSDGSDILVVLDMQYDENTPVSELFSVINGFELTGTGDSLNIDFGPVDGSVEPGFEAYEATHEVESSFTEQSYSAFGTDVTVQPTWNTLLPDNASLTDTANNVNSPIQSADFVTDQAGVYSVLLSVTDTTSQQTSEVLEIDVYEDACDMVQNTPGWSGFNDFDYNSDCIVNFQDFIIFAAEWLDDLRPSGQIEN